MNLRSYLPSLRNIGLAFLSAGLLTLAFPDFELWFLAWFALVPLLWAIERQSGCVHACTLLGWVFGTAFFFGTCWWLTYAPIHYAGMPWPIAYFLILIACLGAGIFPAIFAAIFAILIRRFGSWAYLAAPVVWVFSEFLRYWITGNNWNAIGYSQAFVSHIKNAAAVGGLLMVSFPIILANSFLVSLIGKPRTKVMIVFLGIGVTLLLTGYFAANRYSPCPTGKCESADILAIQPNVPMSGLRTAELERLRDRQIAVAENEFPLRGLEYRTVPKITILPESPMNFMYNDDPEFQQFIGDFARRNNVSVLFNSAEPDATSGKYFNSAVMVGPDGREAVQYDKIYLLPFGEAVPPILEGIVPGFVGNFSYGGEYDLFPLGDAKAGVMICFESHFGQLSREYVRNGADVLIEMTNDGYLGPTPVLRQHLANAVFRAVETNRPVIRVTNVGITAYINERGQVLDEAPSYTESTRVWSVAKSDGSPTFYVRYGDGFAWLCSIITFTLLLLCFRKRPEQQEA